MIKAVIFFLGNIYVHIGNKVYRQVVGLPMGTNCAPYIQLVFVLLWITVYDQTR